MNLDTPVAIGLILAIGGLISGSIWWAATVQNDVSHIRTDLNKIVIDHEARIRALEIGDKKTSA